MTVLGIETATEVCAVALSRDGNVLSEISKNEKHIHAEQLVPMIDELLTHHNLNVAELDGIAISIGPGSFTGLRIGLSVAKGLAFASHLPLVAVSTLRALAYSLWKIIPSTNSNIIAVIEIQRDEFCLALFRSHDFIEEAPMEMNIVTKDNTETTRNLFSNSSEHFLLCGHQAQKFYSLHSCSQYENVTLAEKEFHVCSASAIALLGEMQLQQNTIADLPSLEPTYGKDFITTKSNLFERVVQ